MNMGTQFKTMLLSGMAALSSLYCMGQSDMDRMVNKYRVYKDSKPTKSVITNRPDASYQTNVNNGDMPQPGLQAPNKKRSSNIVSYSDGIFYETNNIDHAQWTTRRREISLIFKGQEKPLAIEARGSYDYQYKLREYSYSSYNRRSFGVVLNRYLRGVSASAGVRYTNTTEDNKLSLSSYTFASIPAGFGRSISPRGITLGEEVSAKYQFRLKAWKMNVQGQVGVAGHIKTGWDKADRSTATPAQNYLLYGARAFAAIAIP